MQTFQYLFDTQGNKTALQIDLAGLYEKTDYTINDINPAQAEILRLFAKGFPNEYLVELKKLISDFLIDKILNEGDKIWNERGYTKETFEKLVQNG